MYKSKRHVVHLSEHDELIVELGFAAPGQLSEASIQYRARIRGTWVEVGRYDNAHGLPHRHRFWREPAQTPLRGAMSATDLVQAAKSDFRRNWRTYRRWMERRWMRC